MKRPRFKKRTWVLVGVIAAVAAMASVGAYAYWTSSGDGTGSATTGDSQAFVVTQQAPNPSNLVPGGPAQSVHIRVNNPASFNQYLTSLTFEIDPLWSEQAESGKPACTDADFTLVQPTVVAGDLTPGDHDYTGTIKLDNTAFNQDNCKGVTVDLLLHAS
jgi:hypothetical protein